MALADLLKRPDPATLRRRLAADLMAASERLELARKGYGEAEADLQEGVAAPAVAAKAEAELVAAKREVDRLTAALRTIDDRAQVSQVAADREALAEAWDKAVAATDARKAAAAKLAKTIEAFATDYQALIVATEAITKSLPETAPDHTAARLFIREIEMAVRMEMFRHDIPWAIKWAWGKADLPDFLAPFDGAGLVVRRWKDRAMARK
ncbi:MAG TPA: hypothetical protein VJ486_06990 [Geothrix sp.]|nr:hypothetical protein [Geothrix sp.]